MEQTSGRGVNARQSGAKVPLFCLALAQNEGVLPRVHVSCTRGLSQNRALPIWVNLCKENPVKGLFYLHNLLHT